MQDEFRKKWIELADFYFQHFLDNRISFETRLVYIISTMFSLKRNDHILNDIIQYYLDIYENEWSLFADVLVCLNNLKEHRLGIISNGCTEQQKKKLKKCDICQYFETIIISEDYHIAKPDLKIFEIACNRAEIETKECIYIGNNLEHDILPVNELGGYGIWINRGNIPSNYVNVTQVKSLEDIPQLADKFLN